MLATMLEASLGARAGRAVPVTFRTLEQLAAEVQQAMSLIAHAASGDSAAAFAEGLQETGLALTLLDARAVNIGTVKAALARLNQLAPMQKPRLVKAFAQCALEDGELSLVEAELLRAMCATLDSPLPPFIGAMPYAA